MYTLDFMNLPGWIALISAFLVIGQLILTFVFGGLDLDLDFDGDGFGDFDLGSVVSPKGLIHFLFGASWYLVLIKPVRESGWLWSDWVIAIIIGIVVAFVIVLLYYWMSKLTCEKKQESGQDLVGRIGYIYLNHKNGNYDISIDISGTTSILQVTSQTNQQHWANGTVVEITNYKDGIYFIA